MISFRLFIISSIKTNKKLLPLFLVFLGIISYFPTLFNGFTLDDHYSIIEAPYLKNLSAIKYIFTEKYFLISHEASFRPVVTLLNILELHFFSINPIGYHIVNAALHIICSILLFCLIKTLTVDKTAFICAMIHSIHPALSEVVCAVAFGEDLLCYLFVVSTLIFIKKFIDEKITVKATIYLIASAITYLLALGSKEAAFFLPAGIVALTPIFTKNHKKITIPLLVNSACLIFFIFLRFRVFTNPNEPALNYADSISKWFGAVYYLPDYIRLYLFPVNLSIIHPVKDIPPETIVSTIIYWMFFIAVFLISLYFWVKKRISSCGFLWFLFALIPVSGITPLKFPFAERYLYLPSLGLNLVTAYVLARLHDKILLSNNKLLMKTAYIISIILTILLISMTIKRSTDWRNNYSLWKSTFKTAPQSPVVHYSLGKIYQDKHHLKKAEKHYLKSISLNPDYISPYINLAVIYMDNGQFDKAMRINDTVISKNQKTAIPYFNNALIYREIKQKDKELSLYIKAIDIDPYFTPAYVYLSMWHLENNNTDEAAKIWKKGVSFDPHWIEGYANLAKYYYDKKSINTAKQILTEGIKHNPESKKLRSELIKLNNH